MGERPLLLIGIALNLVGIAAFVGWELLTMAQGDWSLWLRPPKRPPSEEP